MVSQTAARQLDSGSTSLAIFLRRAQSSFKRTIQLISVRCLRLSSPMTPFIGYPINGSAHLSQLFFMSRPKRNPSTSGAGIS